MLKKASNNLIIWCIVITPLIKSMIKALIKSNKSGSIIFWLAILVFQFNIRELPWSDPLPVEYSPQREVVVRDPTEQGTKARDVDPWYRVYFLGSRMTLFWSGRTEPPDSSALCKNAGAMFQCSPVSVMTVTLFLL